MIKTKQKTAIWVSEEHPADKVQVSSIRYQVSGPIPQPMRGGRIRTPWVGWLFGVGIAVAGLLPGVSCGLKAPPQPRELVVPAPVEDVDVRTVPEGLQITFTLPSKSLDGSRLEVIGGYRILREGPDGKDVRGETRFSVSEMRQKLGKSMAFLDETPEKAGLYRYCVIPFDIYGSHPSRRQLGEFCWEGFLSEEGVAPEEVEAL